MFDGGHVRRCKACGALGTDELAHEIARAAGLDVRRDGRLAGFVHRPGREPRSERHCATVSANALLVAVLEQLTDAQRMADLPASLRASIDHLLIEVARVQGVCEWVAEDLAHLVEEDQQPK